MRVSSRACALLGAAAAFVTSVQALSKVSRAGRYLYNEDGSRFYIKGISYQEQGAVVESDNNAFGEPSTFIDPLAQSDACARDIPYLQQLGVNTIRVYSVNSSLNHDSCMSALSSAGIYTIIDLSLPLNGSIDRTSPSWSTNVMDLYIGTIDAFSKYDNVLAFNVGNEVVLKDSTAVAPYVKAAARDIKAYLASKSSSALVGYAAIDGADDFRAVLAEYLSCDLSGGNSGATSLDIYGLNNYAWCGDSSFEKSYQNIEAAYKEYNIPAYFSEFGCVREPPRLWTEVAALFSSQMTDVWSGGLAFSYFPAQSADGQFGMVTISDDGKTVTTSDDFDKLKTQYSQVSPSNSPDKSSAGSTSYPACPSTSTAFVASNTLPPTPNESACNCLESTLSCLFTPATSNYSTTLGEVIGNGCSLLGQKGGNCDDIGGNGQTGKYGRVAGCDPTIKASFIMSQYYEANNRDQQACSFAGNGTVNSKAPTSASAANAAASSCISDPSATFTPSAPATASNGANGGSATGSSPSDSTRPNSATAIVVERGAFVGVVALMGVGLASALWTVL